MAYKEMVIYLLILNAIAMTQSQGINYQHDRCKIDVERDLLLKVREMQFELSVYRKEAMESKRRLQGHLTQMTEELAEYKNRSMDKQTAPGNEFISILVMASYNRLIWFQKMGMRE